MNGTSEETLALFAVADAAWRALAALPPAMEPGLGEGALGRAWFALWYARVRGERTDQALATIGRIAAQAETGGLSYMRGAAGAWAVCLDVSLPMSPLMVEASRLAPLPSDFFDGLAGVLAVASAADDADIAGARPLTVLLVDLLRRRARPAGEGALFWDWPRSGRLPSPAFAHGVAGPAYALALAQGADDPWVLGARRYEQRLRLPLGWVDGRLPDGDDAERVFREAMCCHGDLPRAHEPPPSDTLCNGAAGIGLVHALAAGAGSPEVIAHALQMCRAELSVTPAGFAWLAPCHGLGGTVELAIAAGDRALVAACREAALRGVRGARASDVASGALLDGLAGAGLTALRLARPDVVPRILPGLSRRTPVLQERELRETLPDGLAHTLVDERDAERSPERALRAALLGLDLEAPARHLALRAYGRHAADRLTCWWRRHRCPWPLVDGEVLLPEQRSRQLPSSAFSLLARFVTATRPISVLFELGEALRPVLRAFFVLGFLCPVSPESDHEQPASLS